MAEVQQPGFDPTAALVAALLGQQPPGLESGIDQTGMMSVPDSGPYGQPSAQQSPPPPPPPVQTPGFLRMLSDSLRGDRPPMQTIPDGQGGYVPADNSRYSPQSGDFLPPGAGQMLASNASRPSIGYSPPPVTPSGVEPPGRPPATAAGSAPAGPPPGPDPGEDATASAYRKIHEEAVSEYSRLMALARQTEGTPSSGEYRKSADQVRQFADAINMKAIDYGAKQAPPRTISEGQGLLDPRTGQYSVPLPKSVPEAPTSVREFEYAQSHGYQGGYNDFRMEKSQGAGGNIIPPELADVHGEDFLKTLPPGLQQQIRAIGANKEPYPSGFAITRPGGQKIAAYVNQAYPDFDAGAAPARFQMEKDAATGTVAKNNNALNTGIGHLGKLSDAAESVNNFHSGFGSSLANEAYGASRRFNQDPVLTEFNTVQGKVAEELTRIYRGVGGAEADIKRELSVLGPTASPEQMSTAIANMAGLVSSKIEANQNQYRATMGHDPAKPMITPENQAILDKIAGRERGAAGGAATPQLGSPGLPPVGESTTIGGVTVKRIR